MNARLLATVAISSNLIFGCAYRAETLPQCFSDHVGTALRAVQQVRERGAYRGEIVAVEHTLCSTHDDRLTIAERLLAASGYSFNRRIEELGHCTDVRLNSPLTPDLLEKQVTTFCGVAAAAGVAYTHWDSSIRDRFLFVAHNYISFSRQGEMTKPGLPPAS